MEVGVRDLRNHTARVIDAVRTGERVTLTVNGEPVANVVPHRRRSCWLSGAGLQSGWSSLRPTPGFVESSTVSPATPWTTCKC
jgi:prevent-host-death family protein